MSTFNVDLLRQSSDNGPVTMINLIKYRTHSLDGDGTGREAYARYTKPVQKLVEARGGRVLWAGPVAEAVLQEGGDVDWDWAILVYYPSRAAFIDMVESKEFLEANEHRRNGVEKHVIMAARTLLLEDLPEQ